MEQRNGRLDRHGQERDVHIFHFDSTDDASDDEDVSTKLDLARAYAEMGDEEGARSILEEVVSEGTAGQQDEANKLLSELA